MPEETKTKLAKAYAICAAKNRKGTPCERPSGWGTDHPGQGRCKFHGGRSPTKHGRYSKVRNTEVRELLERFEADPDPLNVLPELALVRALLHSWLDNYEKQSAALKAWNEAGSDKGGRPVKVPELHEIAPLLDLASKVVSRVEKARASNAISLPNLLRLMGEMGRVVEAHVGDQDTLRRIKDAWLSIRL